ncbi:hypothetical protein LPB140_08350 [Sphingorhabdus lutea]|uniref:Peptidase M48 domain-containing protein n=1 Tax=Sphingorhabdus lutea TaxID=1913578 RepID=A0A1L3JCD9_9SPHN|nr:M48 family metallopeptidase [Sphingorhabdus lutea]APG62796.1 hypothetical protein LPB140_08350 [Sphingorhabdus lutea]
MIKNRIFKRKVRIRALICAALVVMAAPSFAQSNNLDQLQREERDLRLSADIEERDIANSQFIIRDRELNDYIRNIFCAMVGQDECRDVRIYIIQKADFNATMAPNGTMTIWSGLLLRVKNEAQLAAVIGHEYVHYKNRHSIQSLQNARSKMDAALLLSNSPLGIFAAFGIMGSVLNYSREMERDADYGSLSLMANAGYDPIEASKIWYLIREEVEAKYGKSITDRMEDGFFATHPSPTERMVEMARRSQIMAKSDKIIDEARFDQIMEKWRPKFFEDQILNGSEKENQYFLDKFGNIDNPGIADYIWAENVRVKWNEKEIEKAKDIFVKISQNNPEDALNWRSLGLLYYRQDHKIEAAAALAKYIMLSPNANDADIIKLYIGQGK